MLVFVEHVKTEEAFILLGTGLGLYRSEDRQKFREKVKEGVYKMLAVCDKTGEIHWFPSNDLRVVTVDGKDVEDHWL